jgi:hypothetical protein
VEPFGQPLYAHPGGRRPIVVAACKKYTLRTDDSRQLHAWRVGGTARGGITVDLTQEGTQRDHRGEDAVGSLDTFLAHEVNAILDRQHGAARAGAVLQEPAEQALSVHQSSTSDSMQHGRPPRRLR